MRDVERESVSYLILLSSRVDNR